MKQLGRVVLSLCLCLLMLAALSSLREARAATAIPISSVSVSVNAPAAGQGPDYAPQFASGSNYHSANVYDTYTWNDVQWYDITADAPMIANSGIFQAGHAYEVNIWLTPDAGYAFAQGVTGTINGTVAGCVIESGGRVHLYLTFPAVVQAIPSVAVFVIAPAVGQGPDYAPQFAYGAHYHSAGIYDAYTRNDVQWYDITADTTMIAGSDVFQAGHAYEANVWLTPDEGYTFAQGVTGLINGNSAGCVIESGGRVHVYYSFSPVHIPIESAAFSITAPKAGASPDYWPSLPPDADYYSASYSSNYFLNDMMWTDVTAQKTLSVGETFQAGHQYKAAVFLTPKQNCTFTVDAAAMVNGNGATCSLSGNQLRVEYTFPTLLNNIYAAAITITSPRAGAAPDYQPVFPADANYYAGSYSSDYYLNDVTWNDLTVPESMRVGDSVFQGGHQYMVTCFLTPKAGFAFADNAVASINGYVASCYVTSAGQLRAEYSFPELVVSKAVINTQPTAQTVAEGKTAVFSIVASGADLTYQWQYLSPKEGSTWKNLGTSFTGVNTNTLSVPATAARDGMKYRCAVKNAAGTVYSSGAKLTVKPTLSSVKFSASSVQVKKNVTITAVTSTNATKLSMYNGSSLIKTWTSGYTDSGTTRTWKVTYAFSGAGNRTMTFKGAAANGTVTAAKTATITVTAAPSLTSVKFSASSVQVKQNVTITAVTNKTVTRLVMYNGSSAVKTWTSGYTDSGTTRTWKVTYAFSGAGSRTMTFKGFDASGTATAAKTATVTVTAAPAAPTLNSVKFSASSVQVKKTVSITATTSTSVTSLTMYSENGTAAKTWTSGYTDSGSTRTWKVSYTFSGAGSRTMTFRGTGADGTVTGAKTAGITVTK